METIDTEQLAIEDEIDRQVEEDEIDRQVEEEQRKALYKATYYGLGDKS